MECGQAFCVKNSMIKFFVSEENIVGNKIYIDNSEDVKHLSKVLRCKIGDEIVISDGVKWEYLTEILEINRDEVSLKIVDRQCFTSEPDIKVSLFQGIPKGSKMEIVIQKCVEEGIFEITPVFTSRTIVLEHKIKEGKNKRWQKISAEAVKQCKRGIIPQIRDNISFKDMVKELKLRNFDLILCPYEDEEVTTIKEVLRNFKNYALENDLDKKNISVGIIIGPEGGFDLEEVEELKTIGSKIVTLGKTILRTETAGLVALAMTMYELEL